MAEIMETLAGLSLLVFVIDSMASMGLSLKIKQIIELLKPLATSWSYTSSSLGRNLYP